VRVTGDIGFAQTYLNTQRNLAFSTTTSLTDGGDPSQPGEWVTFTAFVAPYSTAAMGFPSGTVQFTVDGSNAVEPITVDAKGRATWETSRLKIGVNRVTATYARLDDKNRRAREVGFGQTAVAEYVELVSIYSRLFWASSRGQVASAAPGRPARRRQVRPRRARSRPA
jgi:hypothetical protein